MGSQSRVQQLLDELDDAGCTPEEVCAACPELLPEVRRRWRQMRAVRADLHALFPTPGSGPGTTADVAGRWHSGDELTQIPGYEVEALLGRGGMGLVYKARHLRLNRFVALKMLITGAYAGPHERARFQREAEAVASLRHAHIVQVHNVGDHEGRPYFTMEFLEGGSLAQTMAGTPQPARPAAALVATLAEAMQVAHRAGIVHRDLKPANILLTAEGTPKVADFGLARHSDGEPALTLSGARIGTPSYMAPEQVIGKAGTIGPATDIYALGAVLYEMLTGRPPFRGETASETERQVLQGEPVSPSRLNPKVPRDLETICLKCMVKEPGRRYGSAAALAADLRRFVEGRPIQARRVGVPERAWRWCRRNPAVAGLAAAAFLAMAIGTAVSAWQAMRARRAVAAEQAAHAAARAREDELHAVLEFVERRVLAAARPKGREGGLGREVTLRQAIDAALPAVAGGFAAQPLVEARLRQTLGQSYLDLGEPGIAAEQFEASRALSARHRGPDDPETLASMHGLANSYHDLGRHAEALKVREQSLALQKAKLGPDHADTLRSMQNLAISYNNLGRRAEAIKLYEHTLALQRAKLGRDHPDTLGSMHNLANSYSSLGRRAEALKLHEQTLALREAKLGPDHPDTLRSMHGLANSYNNLGRHVEALELHEQTLALQKAKLGPDHPDTLRSMHGLANSYNSLGRRAEALKLHEQTLALREAKLGSDHPDTLRSMQGLANSYSNLGRRAEAIKLHEQTLALQKAKLGPGHPDTLRSMQGLASSYDALGRHAEALKLREDTLALQKAELGHDHPDTLRSMHDLANSFRALGRWDEALAAYGRAIALGTEVHDTWNHAAILWARTGDRAGYRGHCRRMLDRFGSTTDPMIAERTAKACLLLPLGGPDQVAACDLADRAVALAQGHWVEPWAEATRGLAAYRREQFADAVAWADRCLARGPGAWTRELPAHLIRATALGQLGRRDEAGAARAKASDLYRTKVASPGGRADGRDWHDQVICEVLRREAEADFLDRDFPPDPFARRTDPLIVARPLDMEPRLIAP
jgi:serine/threonine-protein kinase